MKALISHPNPLLSSLRALACLTLATHFLAASASAQTTWFVDVNNPNAPGDGSPGNPYVSIQSAIDASSTLSGDRLEIAAGIYSENILLSKSVSLFGEDAATTIVDAGGSGRALSMSGLDDVTILRLTFQSGSLMGDGGGVHTVDSELLMGFCVLRDNRALRGAGLFASGGQVTLGTCFLQDNRGGLQLIQGNGGGTYVTSGTTFHADRVVYQNNGSFESQGSFTQAGGGHYGPGTFDDCTFEANRAQEGGGLFSNGQTVFLEDTLFQANRADTDSSGFGGGVHGPATLEQCILRDNVTFGFSFSQGGGAYNATLIDCEVRGNKAFGFGLGGGLHDCTALRCLIVDNEASEGSLLSGSGGGTFSSDLERCAVIGNRALFEGACAGGTLTNCSFFGNTSDQDGVVAATAINCAFAGDVPASLASSASASYCVLPGGFPGVGNVNANPLFVDAAAENLMLRFDSPCIDAGDPNSPVDPDGTRADVGAFPFEQVSLAVKLNFDDLPLGSVFSDPEVEFVYDGGALEPFVAGHNANSTAPHAVNGRTPGSDSTSCFGNWETLDILFPQPVQDVRFFYVCDSCNFQCDIFGEALGENGILSVFDIEVDGNGTTREFVNLGGVSGILQIRIVVGFGGPGSIDDLSFDIVDCPLTIGSYCSSTAFSTGQTSSISAPGGISQSIVEGSGAGSNFVLRADNLPDGQPGIFIGGPLQDELPFFNGFNGTLCISPVMLGRLGAGSDLPSGGVSEVTFDLQAMVSGPGGLSPLGVAPGETFNFQRWNRDPAAGGGAANFSDAIQICFRP